jgi:hypothetical protein
VNARRSTVAGLALLGAALAASACAKGLSPLAGGDNGGAGGEDATTTSGGAGGAHDAGVTTKADAGHGGTGGGTQGGGGQGGATTTTTTTTSTTSSTGGAGPGGGGPGGGGQGPCALGHLVISEVRTRGTGGASDEFVELYNGTNAAVTLDATWVLEGRSTDSGTYTKRWAGKGDAIPAWGHFLITGSSYAQSPAKDDGLASGIKDASSVKLTHNGQIVDAVCFGFDAKTLGAFAGYDCEGTPANNLPHDDGAGGLSDSDASLERLPGGVDGNCTDTGDSAADFGSRAPATPMSTQSPPTP